MLEPGTSCPTSGFGTKNGQQAVRRRGQATSSPDFDRGVAAEDQGGKALGSVATQTNLRQTKKVQKAWPELTTGIKGFALPETVPRIRPLFVHVEVLDAQPLWAGPHQKTKKKRASGICGPRLELTSKRDLDLLLGRRFVHCEAESGGKGGGLPNHRVGETQGDLVAVS